MYAEVLSANLKRKLYVKLQLKMMKMDMLYRIQKKYA